MKSEKEFREKLSRLWMQAEKAMKLAETIRGRVVDASVQELRYAGRREMQAHLLLLNAGNNGLTPEEEEEKWREHAIEACENCIKARDDAIDSIVMYVSGKVEQVVDQIGLPKLQELFPGVLGFRQAVRAYDRLIVASRGDRSKLDTNYSLIEEHLPEAIRKYEDFQDNAEIWIAVEAQAKKEEEAARIKYGKAQFRSALRKILTISAALFALAIGVVSSIVGNLLTRFFPP